MTVRRPIADGNPDWDKSRLSGSFSRRALLSLRAAVILSGGLVAGVATGILGTMVAAMAAWAREEDLAHADLTILIIEPPPRESYARRQPRRRRAQTSGLVFSTIHLGERDNAAADTYPGARHAPDRDRQALLTGPENSEFLHLGICGKDLATA